MSVKPELTEVTLTNTKAELLKAYESAKIALREQEKDLLNAEKQRKDLEKQLSLKTAATEAEADPAQRIQALRVALVKELSALAERYEREVETFRQVGAAVELKKEELKALYGIETAASDLAALLQAQQERKKAFDAELKVAREEFDEEMLGKRVLWAKEKEQKDSEAREYLETLKKNRKREQEEYDYALKRERDQRRNALEDELGKLAGEIEAKRADFESTASRRDADLTQREQTVTQREKEMDSLTAQVAGFPAQMENAVKTAVANTEQRLKRDYEKNEALLSARYEGERNVLQSKIDALERLCAGLNTQCLELSRKQELAYEKVQDIASKAVSAAHRDIVPVPYPAPAGNAGAAADDRRKG